MARNHRQIGVAPARCEWSSNIFKKAWTFIALMVLARICAGQPVEDPGPIAHLDSILERAGFYSRQFQYDSAIITLQTGLVLADAELPLDHPKRIDLLRHAGRMYQVSGHLPDAESLYKQALDLYRQRGESNIAYAGLTTNNLGAVLHAKGDYDEAENLLRTAQTIFDSCPDEPPLWTSFPLINLAELYHRTRQYYKAIDALQACISIREDIPEFDDIALGNNYALLADCYYSVGLYAEAAEARYRILQGLLRHDTTQDVRHCWRLNNIAMTYLLLGDFTDAATYFYDAISCKKKSLPPNDPDLGRTLIGYGNALGSKDELAPAERAFREALAIFMQDSLRYPLDIAWTLNNIGWVNTESNPDTAQRYFSRSLRIKAQHIDSADIDFLLTLTNLARAEIRLGHVERTERILRIIERHHPVHSFVNADVSREYYLLHAVKAFIMGNLAQGLDLLDSLLRHEGDYIRQIKRPASSFALDHELERSRMLLDYYFSFLSAIPSPSSLQVQKAIEWRRAYHGMLRNEAERIRAMHSSNDIPKALLDDLRRHAFLLEEAYLRNADNRIYIDSLESARHALLVKLDQYANPYPDDQGIVAIKPARPNLAQNMASLEFIRYNIYTPFPTKDIGYSALITYGDDRAPVYVPLFTENSEDPYFADITPNRQLRTASLYALQETRTGSTTSFAEIWSKLQPYLAHIRTLYVLPDGVLHLINLAALPIGGNARLGDVLDITRIDGDSVEPGSPSAQTFVLLGDINFSPDSSSLNPQVEGITVQAGEPDLKNDWSANLRGGPWQPLAGSKKEINGIAGILAGSGKTHSVHSGLSVTEGFFAGLQSAADHPSPDVIHIATHGFFFPDPTASASLGMTTGGAGNVYKMTDHPMLRSGLLLSGSNPAWTQGPSDEPSHADGILTAYEISQMDLSDTKLVVLSACETGLGEIKSYEGVYGLQRAFKIAGVQRIIMSLWKVPDAVTAELMISFYKHWITDGMPIRDAFQAAQRDLHDQGLDPYYWAAWVFLE